MFFSDFDHSDPFSLLCTNCHAPPSGKTFSWRRTGNIITQPAIQPPSYPQPPKFEKRDSRPKQYSSFPPSDPQPPCTSPNQSFWGPNCFWTQHVFGSINLLTQHLFGPEICLDPRFVWTQKLFGPKIVLDLKVLGPNIFLDLTLFCARKISQHKISLDPTLFWTTKVFGTQTEIFWPQILFGELK